MAKLGFCGLQHKVGAVSPASLQPAALARAFLPLFERRYNTTLDTSGSPLSSSAAAAANSTSSSGGEEGLAFMYRAYEEPAIIDRACQQGLLVALAWLFGLGVATRVATYCVLRYKVGRRMTSASAFG